MDINPRDAPPGYRAAQSDGDCRCAETLVRCAFYGRGTCLLPPALKRRSPDGYARLPCYGSVRKDGVLAVFLESEASYGNEED